MKIISLADSYLNRFINSLVQEDIKQEPEVVDIGTQLLEEVEKLGVTVMLNTVAD